VNGRAQLRALLTSLRNTDDVGTGEDSRNRVCLNRRGHGVTHLLGYDLLEDRMEAGGVELFLGQQRAKWKREVKSRSLTERAG
jgi:hypothetical protein